MRPIATDVVVVVCVSGTQVSLQKMAEPMKMPFGTGRVVWTQGTLH